jgi:hypothetical protein
MFYGLPLRHWPVSRQRALALDDANPFPLTLSPSGSMSKGRPDFLLFGWNERKRKNDPSTAIVFGSSGYFAFCDDVTCYSIDGDEEVPCHCGHGEFGLFSGPLALNRKHSCAVIFRRGGIKHLLQIKRLIGEGQRG